jgi:diguanylate cyclase
MLRVVGHITQDHDPGFVALACVVCLLATQAGIRLAAPAADEQGARRSVTIRLVAAWATFAVGFWTSMFTWQTAFRPDLHTGFDTAACLVSLLMAMVPAAILVVLAANGSMASTIGAHWPASAAASGLFAAGLLALQCSSRLTLMPLVVAQEPFMLLKALGLAMVLALGGLHMMGQARHLPATLLLGASALFMHLGASGALMLPPPIGFETEAPWPLPTMLGASTLIVVWFWFGAVRLDQRIADRAAKETRRLKLLADSCFEGLVFEHGGVITDANDAMLKLTGHDRQHLIGAHLPVVIKGVSLRSAPGQPTEQELVQSDGSVRPVEVLWRNGPEPGCHVIAVRDLTREKSAQAQLLRLANFDPLTGLPNRDQFERTLHQMLAVTGGADPFALLYLDLDRFEGVYENFGARASDQTLVQVARRLVALVGTPILLARVGRDEFAVLFKLADSGVSAQVLASRALQDMCRPFEVDDQAITITASAGVALYPDHGTAAEVLVRHAATALRRAKREGRGTWRLFEAEFGRRQHEQQTLEKDLATALADGQLSLHYQTFFDSETLEPAGCEALLRWTHPVRGRISPAEFIPLAENNGLIVPIGKWVLATACADAASWDRPVTVAVNVSPAQFAEPGLVTDVAAVLAKTGLPPDRLELEITETALMTDTRNALRLLSDLKSLGVRIAMDDFGTGHSSLGNLRKFPFDKIKIDRSFISDGEDEPGAEAIVQTIIAMGHSLGLTITAEGVETPRQLAMLRSNGCTFVQGFLLARPIPPEQLRLNENRSGWLQPASHAPVVVAPPTPMRLVSVADMA